MDAYKSSGFLLLQSDERKEKGLRGGGGGFGLETGLLYRVGGLGCG